jgi:hypothetical protein
MQICYERQRVANARQRVNYYIVLQLDLFKDILKQLDFLQ